MRISVTRNQGITRIEVVGLVAILIIVGSGLIVPKPDFQRVNVEARRAHAARLAYESTNIVHILWERFDDGVVERDFDHVPPEMTNRLVRVNGHIFRLTYVPELDNTNYTHAANHRSNVQ